MMSTDGWGGGGREGFWGGGGGGRGVRFKELAHLEGSTKTTNTNSSATL